MNPSYLKNIKKSFKPQKGNDLEITSQIDGGSVGIREAKEFVRAKIEHPDYTGPGKGEDVFIRAVDYTSGSDNDEVKVVYGGDREIKIIKKYIKLIDVLEKNLYETGVYNSEMDIRSNPKTSDNKPDKSNAILSAISDKVTEILYGLEDLKTFIQDNSSISHEIVNSTISEFKSYLTSLEKESENLASGSIN